MRRRGRGGGGERLWGREGTGRGMIGYVRRRGSRGRRGVAGRGGRYVREYTRGGRRKSNGEDREGACMGGCVGGSVRVTRRWLALLGLSGSTSTLIETRVRTYAHMESEDAEDCLELDDEALAIVEGHCPGDDEVQCEKDTGLAILPDVSVPSDRNASMRRQKSKEEEFIDRAVKEGDNSMIRFMRKAMAKRELSSHGRNTQLRI